MKKIPPCAGVIVTIRYFVGKLIKEHKEITFDMDELKKVEWIEIGEKIFLKKQIAC